MTVKPPRIVYLHIGKTGGTSLRLMLEHAFGQGSCSNPFVQSHMTQEEARKYDAYPVICGHISRSDQLKWFPNRQIITVLREPIDRCLSFIHYVRSLSPDSSTVAADAHRLSILELIETDEAQRNLHNTMVRQLGGHMLDEPTELSELLKKAKETLREALWVGRQGSMEADLRKLGAILGCDFTIVNANATPSRPSFAAENPQVLDRLYALNGYDLQLWDWYRNRSD